MKRLLAGTALALMASAPLSAQQTDMETSTSPPAGGEATTVILFLPSAMAEPLYASELIGMNVYSSGDDYSGLAGNHRVTMEERQGWEDIGEVGDIVMSRDGETRGVLVDIGGFLGMGEHTVALDMNRIHFLRDESNRLFAAVNSTREELEDAPAYQRPAQAPMNAAAPGGVMTAGDAGIMGAAPATRPAFEREGYMTADHDSLRAEQLQGAPVYDASDENVGNVEQLILTDGKISQAVVDVGGFLGIGAHRIALDFGEMQVMTNSDDTEVRVYIDESREALEQRPEYES